MKKQKAILEIDTTKLKQLKLFEKIDAEYNDFGHSVYYIRVPGGVIRCVLNTVGIDQHFIPLPNSFFHTMTK